MTVPKVTVCKRQNVERGFFLNLPYLFTYSLKYIELVFFSIVCEKVKWISNTIILQFDCCLH